MSGLSTRLLQELDQSVGSGMTLEKAKGRVFLLATNRYTSVKLL